MKLWASPTSPYARKVRIMLLEAGLEHRISVVFTDPWAENPELLQDNPLSKVPTLVLEDGTALFDSPVICEYLDHIQHGERMIPDGQMRWQVKRTEALADGIIDATVALFIEDNKRPNEARWPKWAEDQRNSIRLSLDLLENEVSEPKEHVNLGEIAIATALGYLDLRKGYAKWRDGRPQLTAWHQTIAKRDSYEATQPPTQ